MSEENISFLKEECLDYDLSSNKELSKEKTKTASLNGSMIENRRYKKFLRSKGSVTNIKANTEIIEFSTSFDILEATEESYLVELKNKLLLFMQKQPMRSKKTGELGGWCCKVCGKRSKFSHMMEHAQVHMEGIQISCEFCDKTFQNTVILRKHKINDHLRKENPPTNPIKSLHFPVNII